MHRARVKSPKCRSAVLWTVSLAVGSLGLTGLVEPSQARTFLVPPTVYVGTGTGVTPIPIDTDAPGTPVTLGSSVWGIAITPDGKTVYANNYFAPSVVPIDVAYNTAGTSVPSRSGSRARRNGRPDSGRRRARSAATRWPR